MLHDPSRDLIQVEPPAPKPIDQLTAFECRFPLERDPETGGWLCCAATVPDVAGRVGRAPYCARHASLCYTRLPGAKAAILDRDF